MVSDLDFALPTSITRRRDVFPLGSHPFFLRPPDFARPGFLPVSGINTPDEVCIHDDLPGSLARREIFGLGGKWRRPPRGSLWPMTDPPRSRLVNASFMVTDLTTRNVLQNIKLIWNSSISS